MKSQNFVPKLISALQEGYTAKVFFKDLLAGIIVGIVAIPLSIAIAIASGVKPEQGLITAIIGGFLISAFSGSRFQIGGPTGAFIVIVYNIVQKYGYEGLAIATLMAGVLLLIMGLARLGDVIKFIPYPVIVGFTAGIAVIIFTSQVKDFLGLSITTPDHFIPKWMALFSHLSQVNLLALLIGLITILIILMWQKITDRLPGPLIAILFATALTQFLHLPIETIGSRFGTVNNQWPSFHWPQISLEQLIQLSSPALTIALLAGIESLLSAVVADGMTGRRHRSNMELIAQGFANIASPLFNGIPATGAIARTATNIRNGGRTPISGLIHAFLVLLVFLYLGQWASLIPMPCLAGILILVAYRMAEWHVLFKLLRCPKSDVIVLLFTFALTILVDLTVAIQVGMVLAAFLFMKRMVDVTQVNYLSASLSQTDNEETILAFNANLIPKGVEIFEINGPFFFGAVEKFKDTLDRIKNKPKVLLLRFRDVPMVDASALRALEELVNQCQREKILLILEGAQPNVIEALEHIHLIKQIQPDQMQPDFLSALQRAKQHLNSP